MSTIPQVSAALQRVLGPVAEAAGQASGFVQRQSAKLTGATLVQTLVFGWLEHPAATLTQLTQTAKAVGVVIQAPSLHARFTASAARCLHAVLLAAVEQVLAADPVAIPLLQRFAGVYIQDSSTVGLPDDLADVWAGCGGGAPDGTGTAAALKLQLRLDLTTGALHGPLLQAGRTPDQSAPAGLPSLVPAGALHLRDLGYFRLETLAQETATGQFWLTRLLPQTALFTPTGEPLALAPLLLTHPQGTLDRPITLGARHHLPARLLAGRVPQEVADHRRRRLKQTAQRKGRTPTQAHLALAEWTLLVTNVPAEQLSLREALVLLRARWQIELLFKLWKSHGGLATSRSAQPWRRLCEVYAKLLAQLVQHWLFLTALWGFPERSLVQAVTTVRAYARPLAAACAGRLALDGLLTLIRDDLAAGARMTTRRTDPHTFQLLLDPARLPLA